MATLNNQSQNLPTSSKSLVHVDSMEFINYRILSCQIDGIPYVGVRSICEAIGLNVPSAFRSIKKDEVLSDSYCVCNVLDSKGRANSVALLPVQDVHAWLFSIDPSRVNQEAHPILIEFRKRFFRQITDFYSGSQVMHRQMCEEEKRLIEENRKIDYSVGYMARRKKQNQKRLLEIRDFRFESYRLFEPLESDDQKLEQVFALVDELESQPKIGPVLDLPDA